VVVLVQAIRCKVNRQTILQDLRVVLVVVDLAQLLWVELLELVVLELLVKAITVGLAITINR